MDIIKIIPNKIFLFLLTARDKSERAFGMGFVKLMNADGTTLQDGKHNLIIYKVTLAFAVLTLVLLMKVSLLTEFIFPSSVNTVVSLWKC